MHALSLGPTDADAVVVLLHGFGADAHDLAALVPELDLPGVRFVLPNAPVIHATLSGGWPVQAWYDIRTLEPSPEREDPEGIRASARALSSLVDQLAAPRTVLAGFSQGGAMALHVGLRLATPLAAIVGMSTYLVLPETLDAEVHPNNAATPLWLAHGTEDDVVPLYRGEAAARLLQERGRAVSWQTWAMGHEICPEELEALREFLVEVLL